MLLYKPYDCVVKLFSRTARLILSFEKRYADFDEADVRDRWTIDSPMTWPGDSSYSYPVLRFELLGVPAFWSDANYRVLQLGFAEIIKVSIEKR